MGVGGRYAIGGVGFVPDLEAWAPWRPEEVAAALASLPVTWAVAGGWALDLYLGEESRAHEDIEIVVPAGDMELVCRAIDLEWFAVGDGRAWPLAEAPPGLRQTWGRDSAGHWRLDVMCEAWEGEEWVFRRDPRIRRPLTEAIETGAPGIPYLAPEIVLLFKAKAAREKDEADLAKTVPRLAPDRIAWLRDALCLAHPEHEWRGRLST